MPDEPTRRTRLKRWLGMEADPGEGSEWQIVFEGLPNDAAELVDVLADAGIPARAVHYVPEVRWQPSGAEPRLALVSVRRFQAARANDVIATRPDLDLGARSTRLSRQRQGGRAVAEFATAQEVDTAMTALTAAGIATAVVQEPLTNASDGVGYVISVPSRDLYDAAETIRRLALTDTSGEFKPRDIAEASRPRFEPRKPRHRLPPPPPSTPH